MGRLAFVLMVVLAGFWMTLSGYFHKPILLVTGTLTVLLSLWLVIRMEILDEETVPYVHGKTLGYFSWLFKEIVKANMQVVRAVLSPDMEISPTLVKVPIAQDTDLARATFANSITLTPGTVSLELGDDGILVHALLEEMAAPEAFAEMSARAGWAISDPMQAGEAQKAAALAAANAAIADKEKAKRKRAAARKTSVKTASVKKASVKKASVKTASAKISTAKPKRKPRSTSSPKKK